MHPDYDPKVLKDELKRLKEKKAEILNRNASIDNELKDLDLALSNYRREINVLSTISNAKNEESILKDTSEKESVDGSISDKKFFELDLKLEMSILNAEIKKVLDPLEKEAATLEDEATILEKMVKEGEIEHKKFPKSFLMSADELREEIVKLTFEKNDLKRKWNVRRNILRILK